MASLECLRQWKRFDDLEDEESYERFRRRERRGVTACDYTEVYASMSGNCGRHVVEQRSAMVNWIIEVSVHVLCILHVYRDSTLAHFQFMVQARLADLQS